jgi:hypothetical protein
MSRKKVKYTICPNCDYSFKEIDNFCPNCGQENHSIKVPLKHYVLELFESFFHVDAKLMNTLRDLIVKPGQITRNYNLGKRARYVPPVRFYIFISFILFLLLSLQKPDKINFGKNTSGSSMTMIAIDSIAKPEDLRKLANLSQLENETIDHYLDSIGVKHSWYNVPIYRNYVRLRTGHLTTEEYRHKTRKTFSILMFFLMPLVAFYLRIFHYKQKMFFSEHLVFSIHLHSVAFLIMSLWISLKLLFPDISSNYIFLFIALMSIYILMAIKTVYQQKMGIVILKFVFLVLLYTLTFLLFFFTTIIVSLY